MMLKFLVFICLIFSYSFASKKCYMAKDGKVCYKPFLNTTQLKKPIAGEKYYTAADGKVYKFTNMLKIRLKYAGAILYILENYDLAYVENKNDKIYTLKISSKNKLLNEIEKFTNQSQDEQIDENRLLSIITTLNDLESVTYAKPYTKRKYKKDYVTPQQPTSITPQNNTNSSPSGANMDAMNAFKK